jgi:hypothetical protein
MRISKAHTHSMTKQSRHLSSILESDLGIDVQYRHAPKRVAPGKMLETSGGVLKWYAVCPEGRPVPDEMTQLARSYLLKTPLEARGLGFVVLHRCGNDFYFSIVCTWRGSNEVWETVFYKDGDAMVDFALFPREKTHKPTFCVWELAPVGHEQQTWVRFLKSARDEAAAQAWLGDRYAGAA